MKTRLASWRGLVVALLVTIVAGGGQAVAAGPVVITEVVRATDDDPVPSRNYSSPEVLVDPDDEENMVAATMENRTKVCHLLRSADAGRRWTLLDSLPGPPELPFCFNTSGMTTETPLIWGRDGMLYYGLAGWEDAPGQGPRGNMSALLARSPDLGDTWQTTVVRDARGKTGEEFETNSPISSLAVDTVTGEQDVVYVGWRASYPNVPPTPEGFRAPRPPLVATSTDGGRTFSAPVNLNEAYGRTVTGPDGEELPVEMGFGAPQLTVDDGGTLYVAYPITTPGSFPQTKPAPALPLLLARSTDQGKTFTFSDITPPMSYSEGLQILRWSPEGGHRGTLHVVYEDKPDQPPGGADRDIYYVRSTDGGESFSEPMRLNDDDPEALALQANPNLSVAPDGRVDVVWWDFRNDPGTFVNDVYYAYSRDNGASWSDNVRVSQQSIDRKLGVWSNGFDQREPPGVSSSDDLALVAWDDTRLGDQTTQTQDVFARVVQFEALDSGGSSGLRFVAAALVGLVVAGVLLLAATALARRRAAGAGAGGGPEA